MKSIEKLEVMAERKRTSIKAKQLAIKKETEILKDIETEIEMIKGETYRREINSLNLTPEEFEKFRKYVLGDKNSLMEVIEQLSMEGRRQQKEGAQPSYE